MTRLHQIFMTFLCLLVSVDALAGVDSYRYLHVTIDTPWAIFLFLLPIVLSPFILMAILYWRFAGRKPDVDDQQLKSASENNDDALKGEQASRESRKVDDA